MRLTLWLFGREVLAVELARAQAAEAETYVDNTSLITDAVPGEWTDRGEYEQIYEYPEEEDHFRMGFAGGMRA